MQTALSTAGDVEAHGSQQHPPQAPMNEHHVSASANVEPRMQSGHQRFVLSDPVALRYLVEDPSTTVLDRRRELRGYECYVVEQWTTSRTHPTFIITTHTGDSSHVTIVDVLSVPTDENVWSPRLRVYFKALNQFHASRRDTPLGILMVTNLSGFPSSLTVIPIPGGDVRKHRFDFFVNENLKRLGCLGRTGLSLSHPPMTAVVKFHQLYRTSDKNDIYKSVLELVKLCQSALMLFDKLVIDYADGLLCDVTEKAINDWWVDIGSVHYDIEPHDGILGPTTVAGLLGLLMGARNRLHSVNAPVSKDPFDVEAMKRGIYAFQKQHRMSRTRRLDPQTLDKLHKVTQKVADKERWAVPKAVKSTVAEISGRGGEMVMDVVGRRDRASIAEIETVDIDRFVELLFGARAKWLWLGKPMKKSKVGESNDQVPEEVHGEPRLNKGLVFKPDDHGGFTWTSSWKSTTDGASGELKKASDREYEDFHKSTAIDEASDSNDDVKQSVFKRASNLKDEAKTGLGKVKDAVGFRGHRHKPSTDEPGATSPTDNNTRFRRPLLRRAYSSPMSSPNSPKAPEKGSQPLPAVAEQSNRLNMMLGRQRANTAESRSFTDIPHFKSHESFAPEATYTDHEELDKAETDRSRTATASASVSGSVYNGVDLNDTLPTGPETEAEVSNLLRRTLSFSRFVTVKMQAHHNSAYPRHLSFSLAEDSVLHWAPVAEHPADPFVDEPSAQLASEMLLAKEAKILRRLITSLNSKEAAWTASKLQTLQSVLKQCEQDQEKLEEMHSPQIQSVREMQAQSEGTLRDKRERLEEGAKEIETLAAKLEYEINGLRSKVEDVEAGVSDFEKGVVRVEERVVELEREEARNGWSCAIQ